MSSRAPGWELLREELQPAWLPEPGVFLSLSKLPEAPGPHLSVVQDRFTSAAAFVLPGTASRIPWEFPFVLEPSPVSPKVLGKDSRALHPLI